MSVAKEFTTDRNTDVKTAGNRVIEGCNSLLVAYTRDSFKVRAGLPIVTIFGLFFYSQFFENRRRGAVRRRQGQRPSGAGKAAGTSRQ